MASHENAGTNASPRGDACDLRNTIGLVCSVKKGEYRNTVSAAVQNQCGTLIDGEVLES